MASYKPFAVCLLSLPAYAHALVQGAPEIKVPPKAEMRAWAFDLNRVRLLDGPFKRAMELDAKYMLSIEPDRLLARFRRFSGLEPKGVEYKGWESATISGHSLGHYLSAAAMMHASTGDRRFLDRVNYIVDELALAQSKRGTGFVGGFPDQDRLFAELAAGQIKTQAFDLNGIWVPWYTTHKLFAGLMDAYTLCGSMKARDVMVRLADFMAELSGKLNDDQMQQMLATEHGGLLESFTDVYAVTGDAKYLNLARRWVHKRFMDPLAQEKDNLTGLHGNTNIPKVIGAARYYEVTGERDFHTISRFFWEKVTRERSYVNGGHGDNEYWFPPDQFDRHVTSHTAETCNSYNMLKLTRHLFSWNTSGEAADFYERALYNHILASQEPENGMMIYLCSLKPGHFKVFNTPFESFWCCTGTGFENHAKYGDSIYFHDDSGLYVNLFIASELDWKEKGIRLRQETQFPEEPVTRFTLSAARPVKAELRIRHPWWAETALRISVNGRRVNAPSKPGAYAVLAREWKGGDKIEIAFPMRLRIETLPGAPGRIAFLYGPVVLAGALGKEGITPPMPVAADRMNYDMVPAADVPVIVADDRDAGKWLRPATGKPLTFVPARTGLLKFPGKTSGTNIELVPFYKIWDQRYTVYWNLFTSADWKKNESAFLAEEDRRKTLESRMLDAFRPGEMQPEREHNVQSRSSSTGERELRKYREATQRTGFFSYEMKVDPNAPVELLCTYFGGQANRTFDIFVDDVKVAAQTLNDENAAGFFDVTYAIPVEATMGKEKVTVRFQAQHTGRGGAGPLFYSATLKKQ